MRSMILYNHYKAPKSNICNSIKLECSIWQVNILGAKNIKTHCNNYCVV